MIPCSAGVSVSSGELVTNDYQQIAPDLATEWTARKRCLAGDTITEADIRLFTTLVRFDAVYRTPGFGDTVGFDHSKRHCHAAARR